MKIRIYFCGDFMQNEREYERPYRQRKSDGQNVEQRSSFFMQGVILTQITVFAVLLLILFLVCRPHGRTYEFLKSFYEGISVKDYNASDIYDGAKDVLSFLLEPKQSLEAADTQTDEVPTEKADLTNAESETPAGGEDLISPRENTSFSPFYLSMPIYRPVDSKRITSRFGYRINPVTGAYGFHSGLDLAADNGSEIYAAFDGTVEKAGYSPARGNYIFLNSDGNIKTVYCHCSELLVSEGETVKAGTVIARVGATGQATGPHLHFEIRINGIYYNPEWVIKCDGV